MNRTRISPASTRRLLSFHDLSLTCAALAFCLATAGGIAAQETGADAEERASKTEASGTEAQEFEGLIRGYTVPVDPDAKPGVPEPESAKPESKKPRPTEPEPKSKSTKLAAAEMGLSSRADPQVIPTAATEVLPSRRLAGGELASIEAMLASQQQEIAHLRSRLLRAERRGGPAGDAAYFATYDSVLVQPIQSNSTAFVLESGYDHHHVLFPWKIEHSPRVQFGRETADGDLGWRVRYWQFRHTQSLEGSESTGLIPAFDEAIVGYLGEDGDITVGLDFIESGNFHSHIRTDVIDWELQRSLLKWVDLYAGLRYAKIAQQYSADTDAGDVSAHSEFRGIGPTVALRFRHVLPVKVLSLFANVRGSLLYGQKEYGVVDDLNLFPQYLNSIDPRSYDEGVDSFAGNAELQLGLQLKPRHWLALRVAMEAQHYADVGGPNPTAVFVGLDRGVSSDGPLDDDLSFLGLSASTELRW